MELLDYVWAVSRGNTFTAIFLRQCRAYEVLHTHQYFKLTNKVRVYARQDSEYGKTYGDAVLKDESMQFSSYQDQNGKSKRLMIFYA